MPVVGRSGYPIAELTGMASEASWWRVGAIAVEASWPTVADVLWAGETS